MRVIAAAAVAAAAFAATSTAWAFSAQDAILRAKPAVVLVTARMDAEVTLNCGQGPVTVKPAPFIETGTGWFIDGRGYLITNAHVVDPIHRPLPWVTHELKKKAIEEACVEPVLKARAMVRGTRPDVEEQIRRDASDRALARAQVIPEPTLTVLLSNGVRLPAQVVKFSAPLLIDSNNKPVEGSGRDLALLKIKEGIYPAISLTTREIQIGDPVHILGFPGVVLSHELLNQSVTIDASATNGSVSGYQKDLIGQPLVQTDAPAAHGNSGGPAIGDDAKLVGVVWSVSISSTGAAVQGFNFLIPAKDVALFLQGTPVTKPGDSKFNPVWGAGIEALSAGRYSTALARFEEANKLLPNLVDVKRQLAEADRLVKNPPPRPFPWAWATFGVSLVSVGVYGGMFARRWWKNRYRILPTQVIAFIEAGENPVLLDVRSKSDFETSPLRLPNAVRAAPEAIEAGQLALDIERGQLVITYCTSPEEATSARVTLKLRERGFKNVRILKGGLGGWTNARLPVEAKSYLPSIGLELYKNLTVGDMERRRFKAGDVIFKEGADPNGEAYVIHSGSIDIQRTFDGQLRKLNTMGEGELLGDMGLFRQGGRSADAIAASDVELLVLKGERLDWLIRNRPQLTLEIIKRLSNWVVQSDETRAR